MVAVGKKCVGEGADGEVRLGRREPVGTCEKLWRACETRRERIMVMHSKEPVGEEIRG